MSGAKPQPCPGDVRACWWCWDWGHMLAVVWRGDDGEEDLDEVVCKRCNGSGREPGKETAK